VAKYFGCRFVPGGGADSLRSVNPKAAYCDAPEGHTLLSPEAAPDVTAATVLPLVSPVGLVVRPVASGGVAS